MQFAGIAKNLATGQLYDPHQNGHPIDPGNAQDQELGEHTCDGGECRHNMSTTRTDDAPDVDNYGGPTLTILGDNTLTSSEVNDADSSCGGGSDYEGEGLPQNGSYYYDDDYYDGWY
jgi:hypothetical protein